MDGSVCRGREALDRWKGMSEKERQRWKDFYMAKVSSDEPPTTPSKSQPVASEASPASTEKHLRAAEPKMMEGCGPRFLDRVSDVEAFEKRWGWMKPKIESAQSSSFFLSNTQDLWLVYLDLAHLLSLGCFKGYPAIAARELPAYRINRKKLARVQAYVKAHSEGKKDGDLNHLPAEFAAGPALVCIIVWGRGLPEVARPSRRVARPSRRGLFLKATIVQVFMYHSGPYLHFYGLLAEAGPYE